MPQQASNHKNEKITEALPTSDPVNTNCDRSSEKKNIFRESEESPCGVYGKGDDPATSDVAMSQEASNVENEKNTDALLTRGSDHSVLPMHIETVKVNTNEDRSSEGKNVFTVLQESPCEVESVTETNDPASYVHKVRGLKSITKMQLIVGGAYQPKATEIEGKQFPQSKCGSHQRSFSENWYLIKVGKDYFKRKWLSYSPTQDAVFCHFCIFFSGKTKETTFTTTGYRDWKKANEKLAKHEQSQCHINAAIDFENFCSKTAINEQISSEAATLQKARQEKVQKNREVMNRLIDAVLFLAKQGLAFRGHRENTSAYEGETSKGNFLALTELISKYDEPLANHLAEVRVAKLKKKDVSSKTNEKKTKSGRGKLVSFMSAESQNKIINTIGTQLSDMIVDEINAAGIYSFAMDCTTDSSHADQLSIIMRYLNESVDIVERLVCVERVKDSTAEGLFSTLQEILRKRNVTINNAVGQSYDGASVMTGKYKGVKTLVQQANPQCLFIWTFDHVLNLVIMEACGSCIAAKSLFGVLEKLYAFFSQSRKRSDVLEEKQKASKIAQIHRPQRVSTTRWWSHQKALENVFFVQNGSLFDCIVDTLQECQSQNHSREIITDAEALEQKLTSFETILTAHVFNQVFAITNPASFYLQSEKIDLLTAVRLVEAAESHLEQLRDEFENVYALTKAFCEKHELVEQDFVKRRIRRKKRLPGELCNDEITEDQKSRYQRETFIHAIDTAIVSIHERFSSHKAILSDFSLLDPERFQDVNADKVLPAADAFQNVAGNYGLDEKKLREEYLSFVATYPKLKAQNPSKDISKSLGSNTDVNRENYITVLKVLSKFNLQSAFPQLYRLYKILVTLPICSTKCERTFSKLKYVKNRLRSTMGQQRLNSLMIINVEQDLTLSLNYDELINSFANTPLLQNLLKY